MRNDLTIVLIALAGAACAVDPGREGPDSGLMTDAGPGDAGHRGDAGDGDAGLDAGGTVDAGPPDGGVEDGGLASDAGIRSPIVGMNAHLPRGTSTDFQLMAELGVTAARFDFNWEIFEPMRGVFQFTRLDEVVANAKAHNLRILATVGYTPAWAGPGMNRSPTNPNDWRDAIRTVVTRYKYDVECWGIWNEPDLRYFWDEGTAAHIQNIVIPAISVIRQLEREHNANPSNPPIKLNICGPELGYPASLDAWLTAMEAARIDLTNDIDIITQHAYDKNGDYLGAIRAFQSIRPVLRAHHLENKPIWLTESGWDRTDHSDSVISMNIAGLYGGHERVCAGTYDSAAPWPQWQRTYYYHFPYDRTSGWGLLDANRAPLPQYYRLQRWAHNHPTTSCQ